MIAEREGQRGRSAEPSRTPAGETTRLWKRKKPNSPAGNFPPSRGSSRPPTPPCHWPGSSPPCQGGAELGGWGHALS